MARATDFRGAVASLRHRGPDGSGEYQDVNVWLGHTRLSILDLTEAGSQPMRSADGRFVISYNGEVYNFKELAKAYGLERLRSHSDTEVVLQLFQKLGVDSLVKLNGMFAFAIYDIRRRKLWLARDRLGIKPLYYWLDARRLVFASEIKGIMALVTERPTCDFSVLHEWLYYGNTLGERTLFHGVEQLLPGHYLEIDLNSFEAVVRPYWLLEDVARAGRDTPGDERFIVDETRRLLEQAVRRQLVSDVPVGVFLSGGVDSSSIVAFAARHYGRRLATYSVGFDFCRDPEELPRAKRIADRYGTEHHEIHVSGGAVGDLVEKLVEQHDQPFSDAANIPLYLMASHLGARTKVVLQGDGGDELFGGYRRYATLSAYSLLHPLALSLRAPSKLLADSPLVQRLRRYVRAFAAEDIATTMAMLLTPEDRESRPQDVFAPEIRNLIERSDPFECHRAYQRPFADQDRANQMSFLDLSVTLPNTFLEKVDRATMAASLEVRVPFLDVDLVDFVVSLPGYRKMPWGSRKWLLKSALAGVVPEEVLQARKKGLEVPYGRWLQGPLKPLFFDHLSTLARRHPGVLDVEHVKNLFEATRAKRRNDSHTLWKVLNFAIWANSSAALSDARLQVA